MCKGNILLTENPCNYTLRCFRCMIKEITKLHHGKCTDPDVPVAAALYILILPRSRGGLKVFLKFKVSFKHSWM